MTRAVRTAQFGYSSLITSAIYKESREARLSLIPYRTRKSENGESRWVDSVCAGIDSRKSVHPIRSKERNAVELSAPSPKSLEFRCLQNGSSARRSEPDWR